MRATTLFILVVLTFTSCAGGGYVRKSRSARRAFENRKYDKALAWYHKQKPGRTDRLLYLLDQGVILHTAGRYQASLAIFKQAIDLSDQMHGPQVASKSAAVITNDNYIPYKGEKFERLLMQTFQVMNYLGLGQYQEALIEVRRLHNRFGAFLKQDAKPYLQNAFATYLSGLTWEANGKLNDAYIDYKNTYRMAGGNPILAQDLLRGSRWLGFLSDHQRWRKVFGKSYRALPRNRGELIVLLQAGSVIEKRSTEERHSLQIVPVPYYPELSGKPRPAKVKVVKGPSMQTVPLYDVDAAAVGTLRDNKAGIVARAIARLAAKEGAAVAVGKKIDKDLGVLLGILVLATNRADMRSWLTLPSSFQVAKLSLPAGTYQLKLIGPQGEYTLPNVTIEPRKKRFVMERIF